jgi:PIN domain nuclease of toxin-antitoxin system
VSDPVALLDASALVAVLFQEIGHDVVETILDSGRAATTSIALAEALNVARRKEHELDASTLRTVFAMKGLRVEPVIEADAIATAVILPIADQQRTTRASISLADATCLAVARRLDAPVVTGDRQWTDLSLDDVTIRLFR